MAPHAENQKPCASKTEKKKVQDELFEKLKIEEAREKKKLEKEAKRRAELEKIKSESLIRQAALLVPEKKEKHTVHQKNTVMKSQPKTSTSRKQKTNNTERNNQSSSYESCNSKPKSSAWNKQQPERSENRFRHGSSSSENSWNREGSRNWQSNSKYAPVSDSLWGDADEHFPVLGAEAPVPQVNVWEERISKREEIKALEPQSEYDEEAMLQQALAMSMMEATLEEQRKQKLDEEYRLQMAALEHNPEILEEFNTPNEFIVADKSQLESHNGLVKSTEEQYPKQGFSRNVAVTSVRQKDKISVSGGARPKMNKIIDSFGGWGLKNTKKEKLSDDNFVDDIVNEKPSKKAGKYNTSSDFQKDSFSNDAKKPEKDIDPWLTTDTDVQNPVVSDPWPITDSKNVKTSSVSDPWNSEVLYDGKGTFTDTGDDNLNFTSSVSDYCSISSKKKIDKFPKEESPDNVPDTWLNSNEETVPVSDGWGESIYDKKLPDVGTKNGKKGAADYSVSGNNAMTKCENSKDLFSSFETNMSIKEDKSHSISDKRYDSVDVSAKTIKNAKGATCNVRSYRKQNELSRNSILSQFENTYNYIVGDSGVTKDEDTGVQTLLNNDDTWSDKSSNKSTASSSLTHNQNLPKTELDWEESIKFGTVEESGVFSSMTSNKNIDTPPILPPQPAPTVPVVKEENQTFTTKMSSAECIEEPPHILPPQACPEMPSQYLFNPPIFPGVSPMLGLGMDPVTMRQMLMLSNPFFASQLLAMEQYYRALGMPVDLFSFPAQTMPNMPFPGMMGASMEQNTFSNAVNVNAFPAHDSQLQDQSVPVSENQESSSNENPSTKYPPGFDENGDIANPSGMLENGSQDSWYSSMLTNDSTSVIPPPKPPTVDEQFNFLSISEPSEPNQKSASSFNHNNINTNQYICGSSSSALPEVESHKPFTAIEACITKTEVTGWSDPEDESFDKRKPKTNTWDDDDGWGTDNLPAKSVKNPSVYEDKKKIVHRQPARQPQLSRFQNNRRYN